MLNGHSAIGFGEIRVSSGTLYPGLGIGVLDEDGFLHGLGEYVVSGLYNTVSMHIVTLDSSTNRLSFSYRDGNYQRDGGAIVF